MDPMYPAPPVTKTFMVHHYGSERQSSNKNSRGLAACDPTDRPPGSSFSSSSSKNRLGIEGEDEDENEDELFERKSRIASSYPQARSAPLRQPHAGTLDFDATMEG